MGGRGVHIATVVNFPTGEEPAGVVMEVTEKAVADGADEIDMVVPYQSFLEGREEMIVTRPPASRAPLAKACVNCAGSMSPSSGSHMPPIRS